MKITRQIVADKIADYLHGKVSQEESRSRLSLFLL